MSATPAATTAATPSLAHSVRRLLPLAWPVLVGQLSVLAFSTVDTVLVARHDARQLAAFAVGAAAYVTVFVGFMGVVLALSPIAGRLFGAKQHGAAGRAMHQAVWIALAFTLLGSSVLAFPAPFLWLAKLPPELVPPVRHYLLALACALPAALLFTVYRAFNTAVSRPKAVMLLQVGGLALKVPLSTLLVFGAPSLGLPALGAVGCGIATCLVVWTQALAALQVLRRDRFYAPFALFGRGLDRPDRAALLQHLKLGVPMGAAILVEVTGLSMLAFLIARLGADQVAGHQITANLVSLLFMVSLALGSATGTLVAQRIGAGDAADARRLGWHGLVLGAATAMVIGVAVTLLREPVAGLYTRDPVIIAAALPLLAWVALFHVADAVQTLAVFVLRAWHVTTTPLLIYAFAIWGVGLAGGHALVIGALPGLPSGWSGASGYWFATTLGLVVAAVALCLLLAGLQRLQQREQAAASAF